MVRKARFDQPYTPRKGRKNRQGITIPETLIPGEGNEIKRLANTVKGMVSENTDQMRHDAIVTVVVADILSSDFVDSLQAIYDDTTLMDEVFYHKEHEGEINLFVGVAAVLPARRRIADIIAPLLFDSKAWGTAHSLMFRLATEHGQTFSVDRVGHMVLYRIVQHFFTEAAIKARKDAGDVQDTLHVVQRLNC